MIMRRGVLVAACALSVLASGCDKLFGVTEVAPPLPDAARPTTALVQQQTASSLSALRIDATLPALPENGHMLVVIGATDRSNLATPTGGGVGTWMRATFSVIQSNIEIWYGVTDGSSATVTIACACADAGNMRLLVTEWSGIIAKNTVENSAGTSGTVSNPAATLMLSTLDSRDLLVFGVSLYGSIGSTATGDGTWSALDSVSVGSAMQSGWYQLVDQPGSYSATVPVTASWDAVIAAFRTQP